MKSIKIDEKLHKELKIYCAKNNLNIKGVIESIIKEMLKDEKINQ